MEFGRLTRDWFRILVGDTIDYTEVRGWRKTGRPKHINDPSFTELKAVRCIINGPEMEDIYEITQMSKSSIGRSAFIIETEMSKPSIGRSGLIDETEVSKSSISRSELIDEAMEEIYEKQYGSDDEMFGDFVSTFDEITMEESDPYSHEQKESPHEERLKSVVTREVIGETKKKIVLAVKLSSQTKRQEMMKALSVLRGIESVSFDETEGKVTVIGDVDPWAILKRAIKIADTQIISFGPASERLEKQHESEVKFGYASGKDDKPPHESEKDEATIRKQKKSKCSVM